MELITDDFIANLANSDLGTVLQYFAAYPGTLVAPVAYKHYFGGINRTFLVYDSALLAGTPGLLVLGQEVDSFNDDLTLFGQCSKYFASFRLILTGDDFYGISFFYMQFSWYIHHSNHLLL
jgi:hypothetical protein